MNVFDEVLPIAKQFLTYFMHGQVLHYVLQSIRSTSLFYLRANLFIFSVLRFVVCFVFSCSFYVLLCCMLCALCGAILSNISAKKQYLYMLKFKVYLPLLYSLFLTFLAAKNIFKSFFVFL